MKQTDKTKSVLDYRYKMFDDLTQDRHISMINFTLPRVGLHLYSLDGTAAVDRLDDSVPC